MIFVILWILLAELPQPGNGSVVNHTLITVANYSDDTSQFNSGDAKAFWVSWSCNHCGIILVVRDYLN